MRVKIGDRVSPQVPMVVDTGADSCFIDHQLAYSVGVNPVSGGALGTVQGLGAQQPTARYPVELYLPLFELTLNVDVFFAPLQTPGWNGLLGHQGFLDQFKRVTFIPGDSFELEMK